jgi:hypothetical protein
VVWKEGNMFFAKNGLAGRIEFDGPDAASVIQQVL